MVVPERVIEIAEETIAVERRRIPAGRVRVVVTPGEHEQPVEIEVTDQRVHVERVPIGRFVDTAPAIRNEGETTIIPVLEERAVTTVRLFLREEVRVSTIAVTRTERHSVQLRQEHVRIERQDINQGETTDE